MMIPPAPAAPNIGAGLALAWRGHRLGRQRPRPSRYDLDYLDANYVADRQLYRRLEGGHTTQIMMTPLEPVMCPVAMVDPERVLYDSAEMEVVVAERDTALAEATAAADVAERQRGRAKTAERRLEDAEARLSRAEAERARIREGLHGYAVEMVARARPEDARRIRAIMDDGAAAKPVARGPEVEQDCFVCWDCGVGVAVDEDGCCVHCGALAGTMRRLCELAAAPGVARAAPPRRGRNEPTGRTCCECHRPTRTGPLGGPDNDTEYSCDEDGCDARFCWDCLAAHERSHAAPPRDETRPPPGWHWAQCTDDAGMWHDSVYCERDPPALAMPDRAWEYYDAEHGYAPPVSPGPAVEEPAP